MSKFVHLHTHSHYSLLDGMSKIDELVKKAKKDGQGSLAITDHGNLYGAIEFYKTATKAGVKPILGVEAYVAPGDHKEKNSGVGQDKYFHLVLLVKNQTGWENLIKLVTSSYLEGFYYKPRMDKEMLREHSEGLIALSGCLGGEIGQALINNRVSDAEKIAGEYREIFGEGNYYIEIGKHPAIEESERIEKKIIALSKKLGIPLVATRDSHYIDREDRSVHDILLCIQTGKTMNDEKRFQLEDDFHFSTQEEMINDFAFLPEAIDNTVKIAQMCNVKLELGKILLPSFDTGSDKSGFEYLEDLVKEKVAARYKDPNQEEVKNRVEYELGVIKQMGFSDYFLIVADFISWAKERGIVVGPGRGSAAGSIISYILGITDLDPLEYGLLFERFLNPSRVQMPDIDIDFTDTRRDEVFGYLGEKYGEDHVAHIITFGTMAARAAIRDVGRALDIELAFCDKLAKLVPFGKNLDQSLKLVPEFYELYKREERATQIIDAAKRLEGVARHASVHACGTVISADPLTKRVPLQYSPQKDNIVITQFEMHAIEDLGLLKMDLLGLKNLTIIEDALRLIEDKTGKKIDISKIPLTDERAFELFQSADTVGVFQLESGGMRRYLKDLRPTELEDIIAMVALYRPGPMELIPSYIARKFGKEEVSYIHPRLEPILKNTYGIGIYQEQMMRIASDLAGYSLAEADTLRKAIGKKIKKLLDQQEEKLVAGLMENGIPEATAKRIWDLFPPFARYGFNRSHAASYAMIAYRTAYLKANYPVEFMTALFNADSGDVERIAFLIGEAKKMKIEVLAPDVNKSSSAFTPEPSTSSGQGAKAIRFGMAAIKNVGNAIVEAIVEERARGGEFESFAGFITRVKHKDLNKKSLESLIKCGALDGFGIERNTLLENIDIITKFIQSARKEMQSNQSNLFGNVFESNVSTAALDLKEAKPASGEEKLAWEKELLGLYVSEHPLALATEKLAGAKPTPIKEMLSERSTSRSYRLAGMVASAKNIITKTGKAMAFVKLEDLSGSVEMVVFPDVFAEKKDLLVEGSIVVVLGRLSFRNGETSMICEAVKELK